MVATFSSDHCRPAVGQQRGSRTRQRGPGRQGPREIRRYRRGLGRWEPHRRGRAARRKGQGHRRSPGQGHRMRQGGHHSRRLGSSGNRQRQRRQKQTQIQAEGWQGWPLQTGRYEWKPRQTIIIESGHPGPRCTFSRDSAIAVSDQPGSSGLGLGIRAVLTSADHV